MAKNSKKQPMYDPDVPTAFEAWLFSTNFVTRICFMLMQALLYALRPLLSCPRMFLIDDVIGAAC